MTYKTSKDYDRLWEIYKRGEGFHIFAYISYYGNDSRNSCIIYPTEGKLVIALWSDELLQYRYKTEFLYDCKRFNLEFLDPEPPTCETCKHWNTRYHEYHNKLFAECKKTAFFDEYSMPDIDDKDKIVASWGEGGGELLTGKDFHCQFHEPKESEEV